MADDRKNATLHKAAFVSTPQATCPIPLGETGLWTDLSGNLQMRTAEGADVAIPEVAETPASRLLTAGAGLTGGGDLSADRTFNVIANIDGSMVVNADDIQVGVLATDAQHGLRGNGTQHTNAVAGTTAGFISGASQKKVDGIAANVTAVQISAYPAVIGDIVRANPTAGGFTITLPAISAANSGQHVTVKNVSISVNALTIATTGVDTLDGSPTISITTSYGALDFVSDGSGNWMVL